METNKLVGQRLQALRQQQAMNQTDFGVALGAKLGAAPWGKQAVSNAEKGGHRFTDEEIHAVAAVLGMTATELTTDVPQGGASADRILTPQQLAKETGTTESFWARKRSQGDGPRFSKLSPGRRGQIRYRRSDVDEWLNSNTRQGKDVDAS